MEDGPYKNTRSASGNTRSMDKIVQSELQETFQRTPKTNRRKSTGSQHQRTPSGHLLTGVVGDIRNFFDAKVEKHIVSQTASPKLVVNQVPRSEHSTVTAYKESVNKQLIRPGNAKVTEASDFGQTVNADHTLHLNDSQDRSDSAFSRSRCELESVFNNRDQSKSKNRIENLNPQEGINTAETMADQTHYSNDPQVNEAIGNPEKVMDLKLVIQMFKEIKQDLNAYKRGR